jgi:dTDP-4-amino-4,6-dideoxygalactose transaminase
MRAERAVAAGRAEAPFAPWPFFDEDEIEAVARVLRSGRVNQWTGPEVGAFEAAYAGRLGRKRAIALANGTLALELALRVALPDRPIGPGDEVVVTPRSFVASAGVVAMAGATPVFADVDPASGNLTAATIEAVLTPRTRAVIPVHLAGWPCDMDAIMALARARDLVVIEDCAQAHGATWQGREVGGFGGIACLSFCQDKIITTGGEGGMLLVDDEDRFRRAWAWKDHGKSFAAVHEREHPPGFRWLHEGFGSNWRMTGLQAAIGLVQLGKLGGWVARRRANAAFLCERLGGHPALELPAPPAEAGHAFYKLYLHLRPERLRAGWDRDRVMVEVAARGVPCFGGSCSEIYRELAFVRAGLGPQAPLPVAAALGRTSLMLLVHPTLCEAALGRAADTLLAVLDEAAA